MAEQADAMVSNTIDRKVVRVRFPLRAPRIFGRFRWSQALLSRECHEVPALITD